MNHNKNEDHIDIDADIDDDMNHILDYVDKQIEEIEYYRISIPDDFSSELNNQDLSTLHLLIEDTDLPPKYMHYIICKYLKDYKYRLDRLSVNLRKKGH